MRYIAHTSTMAVYGFGENYDQIDWSKEDDKYNVYVEYEGESYGSEQQAMESSG